MQTPTFVLDPAIAEGGWTQSEITTLDDCGEKWFRRYHQLLRKKGEFSWALVVGSAFHSTMEQMYATAGKRWAVPTLVFPEGTILTGPQMELELYWNAILGAMCTAYSQHYSSDFDSFIVEEIEEVVEVEFQGFKFRGMIDLRFRPNDKDRAWIMDHKTSSRMDTSTTAGWDFRFQFMFYLWLKWKQMEARGETSQLRGYYINGVKKTQLRQTKADGNLEGFAERVRQDMVFEPQKYFYREKLVMTRGAMQHFEDHVLAPKIERLHILSGEHGLITAVGDTTGLLAGTVAHNMNTSHCQAYGRPCEFLELCRHGDQMDYLYEKRATKHEELEAEAE